MRKHHHHQRLLILATVKFFIIFRALLLNGQLAAGPIDSCNASSSPTCTVLKNITSTFPFLTSQACGSASSFFISECSELSSDTEKPRWPNFLHATTGTLGSPFVMGFSNPFLMRFSMNASLSNEENDTNSVTQAGVINLTWSETLVNKPPCQSLAPLNQTISEYLPQSINLISFAHSAFHLTPSNILLLFNCKSSSPVSHKLLENSAACTSYEKVCNVQNSNCSQYIPDSQELNLSQVTEGLDCKSAMFFVTHRLDPAWPWRPGLIQLNWSTNNNLWMNSILNSCEGCLQTNGSCGYKSDDIFQCYCYNNMVSPTNCTGGDNRGKPKGCNYLLCHPAIKIAIGGASFGAVIVVVVFFLYYHGYKRKGKGIFTNIVPLRLSKKSARQNLFGSSSLIISGLDLDGLMERPIEYQYASIVFATKSFSNLLGKGGFGAVYKGTLADAKDDVHMQIAVKVLEVRSTHTKKQFCNEVAAMGRIHHVNVVRLLGFCIEQNGEMLVYEYVVNGSLNKWLFRHYSGSQKRVLLWEQRYAIAVGIAKGLSYLHEECRHRIVHCDIKPENILLDEQMCPKIADFGLARLMDRKESAVVTLARGTPGYIAPEFWIGGESQLSTKFDVYSYGMVLLELISGQRNFGDGKYFPETAFEAVVRDDFKSIVDVRMGIDDDEVDGMQWQQVRTGVLVALWCIQDHPTNRPSMSEVVQYLEGKAAFNEQPPRPTIASISARRQHVYASNDLHNDITPISGGR